MAFNVLKLALVSVLASIVVTAFVYWFTLSHPVYSTLTSDIYAEWAYMLKPEKEVLYYRVFVFAAILAFVIGFLFLRNKLLKPTPDAVQITVVPHRFSRFELIVPLAILFFIVPYDINAVLNRVTDYFYHFDSFFMAPGWVVMNNLHLNIDINTEYSVLIPTIFAKVTGILGHFDYPTIMSMMIALAIIYWVVFYIFLRVWLNSKLVAVLGIVAGIYFQMFHPGIFPINWQFPSTTVMRFFWDMGFFICLWAYLNHGSKKYLYAAAAFIGLSLAWMIDVGIYLCLSFVAFLIFDIITSKRKAASFFHATMSAGTISGVALMMLWLCVGNNIFLPAYWHNTFEFAGLFLQGWGALPITTSLDNKQYMAFIMGLLIPIAYVISGLYASTLVFFNKIGRQHILVAVLAIYGLGLFHYYIFRSGPTSYAVVCLPIIAIACWLISEVGKSMPTLSMRLVSGAMLGIITLMGISNPLVRNYPGLWNMRDRAKLNAYTQEFLKDDVVLIQQYTNSDDRVPILGSFEVTLLRESSRKPFFYYFPIFQSDDMKMLQFRGTYLHTKGRMQQTLVQLEKEKPNMVFVEKKFFNGEIPAGYYQNFETLMILMVYMHQKYTPLAQGKYFVALKRKD